MGQESTVFLDDAAEYGFDSYRAVSKCAVASLILGVISLLGLLFVVFLFLAFVGLILAICGYRSIHRYPTELSGRAAAVLGLIVCTGALMGGVARHSYVYATEVPDGYERISFEILKANAGERDVPPEEALKWDGKPVFLKGYVYPGGQQTDLKQFVLVPDLGTCCFGGQPKLTHMIQVTLEDPLRIDYSMGKRKLAGTLRVDRSLKPVNGLGGVYYQLTAKYAK